MMVKKEDSDVTDMELSMECVEALRQELQDEGGATISNSYKSSLEELVFDRIIISEDVLMELTKVFQSNTTLQEVSMTSCKS